MAEPLRLRVAEVVEETADAKSIVFEGPALPYRPGQFLTLRIGDVARSYSLSSSPHMDDRLAVTVKRTVDGYGSNWIHEHVEPGMTIEALPPGGVFSPRTLDDDLLCCAAGSGITPVLSIVKSVLAAGSGRITLVYANRDERSVIFADRLRDLVQRYPDRLTVLHWLESVQGLPSVAGLREVVRPFTDRETFVCGPGPFMQAASAALAEVGAARVRMERFVSLAKNPFQRPARKPSTARTVPVDVTLDGRRRTVDWPVDTRLLTALRDAGLDVPSSCEEGRCAACVCRRVSGTLTMVANDVLDATDLADGYVLACQALPDGEPVMITYD